MKKALKNLRLAHGKYESAIKKMEGAIFGLVQFEFSIFHQQSDGFVILRDFDMGQNAPLDKCIKVIEEKGILTIDDYENLTI